MSLKNIPLDQIVFILRDLVKDPARQKALAIADPSGRSSKKLAKALAELDELPAALTATPLADTTGAQDDDFDARASAIFWLGQALASWPEQTATTRAVIAVIAQLVPSLALTKQPYGAEAAHAVALEDPVEAQKDLLAATKTPDGQDLYVWAKAFVASGTTLGDLIDSRGEIVASAKDRKKASTLRPRILGDLNSIRNLAREAVELDPDVPRDLEATLFSRADEIQRLQDARQPPKKTSKPV